MRYKNDFIDVRVSYVTFAYANIKYAKPIINLDSPQNWKEKTRSVVQEIRLHNISLGGCPIVGLLVYFFNLHM